MKICLTNFNHLATLSPFPATIGDRIMIAPAHDGVQAPLTCVADIRAALGESPVWDADAQRLWWVDILGRRLWCLDTPHGTTRHWMLPDIVGSIALCADGHIALALASGIYGFHPETGFLTSIATPEPDRPTNRLNDGKVGPDGAFWVGSMDDRPDKAPVAALYRIAPDGGVTKKIDGIIVSNGLAWSGDGRTLFHSDSRGPWIDAWDFDPLSGTIVNRRRIATLSEAEGRPDGAATAQDGTYWSCGVSAGCLNRFAPDGTLVARYRLPIAAPTMCAFGGPDLKTLFITSLRHGLSAETLANAPQSGGVFAMPVTVPGVPVPRFDWRRGVPAPPENKG